MEEEGDYTDYKTVITDNVAPEHLVPELHIAVEEFPQGVMEFQMKSDNILAVNNEFNYIPTESEGIDLLCPTCLSEGRTLLPLQDAGTVYCMLLAGLEQERVDSLVTYSMVCWECATFLHKMLRFRQQLLTADHAMRNATTNAETVVQSFSRLGSVVKIGADVYVVGSDPEMKKRGRPPKSAVPEVLMECPPREEDVKPVVTETVQAKVTAESSSETSNNTKRPARTIKVKKVKEEAETEQKNSEWKPRVQSSKKMMDTWKKCLTKGRKKNVKIVSMVVSKEEMLNYREEERTSDAYLKLPQRCETCIKSFRFISSLQKHNSVFHSESAGPHRCDICAIRVPTPEQLARHTKKHYNLYVCSVCGRSDRSQSDMLRHYASAHERGRQYECSKCNENFTTDRQLRYHHEKKHKASYKCNVCGKTLVNQQCYKLHMEIHTGKPVLECSYCAKKCRGQGGLYAHMLSAHDALNKGWRCEECDVNFKTEVNYRSHLRTSSKHATVAQLKFKCAECAKMFRRDSALRQHQRDYHGARACPRCGKTLHNRQSLLKHIKYVHDGGERPRKYVCELCGKAFKSKFSLDCHTRTHTGERPYECNICNTKYTQASTLRKHMQMLHRRMKEEAVQSTEPVEEVFI